MKLNIKIVFLLIALFAVSAVAQPPAPTWTLVGSASSTLSVGSWGYLIDPATGNQYIAADPPTGGGIAVSTDHGATWSRLDTPLCNAGATTRNRNFGIAPDGTIYTTSDHCTTGGLNYIYWLDNVANPPGTVWTKATGNYVLVSGNSGMISPGANTGSTIIMVTTDAAPNSILISTDNARSFNHSSTTPPTGNAEGAGGALKDPNSNTVYAMYSGVTGNNNGGVYCSTDSGANWARIPAPVATPPGQAGYPPSNTSSGNIWPKAVAPPGTAYAGYLFGEWGNTAGSSRLGTGIYAFGPMNQCSTGTYNAAGTNEFASNPSATRQDHTSIITGIDSSSRSFTMTYEDFGFAPIYSDDGTSWQATTSGLPTFSTSPTLNNCPSVEGCKTANYQIDTHVGSSTYGQLFLMMKNGDIYRTTIPQSHKATSFAFAPSSLAVTVGNIAGPFTITTSYLDQATADSCPSIVGGRAAGTWSTSNPAIATINPATGIVTGVSVGTTTPLFTCGGVVSSPGPTITVSSGTTIPQQITVLGIQQTVDTSYPSGVLAHLAAAPATCPAGDAHTGCVGHTSGSPGANGLLLFNSSGTPLAGGPLDKCLQDVAAGTATNGYVIVLDAGFDYAFPQGHAPSFNRSGTCQQNLTTFAAGCTGLFPPTIQLPSNSPFHGGTPQYCYVITSAYNSLPGVGARVNPITGDGYSSLPGLLPNVTPSTQMAGINAISGSGYPGTFFGNGPANYRFIGLEYHSTTTFHSSPPTSNGFSQSYIYSAGPEDAARPLFITNAGQTVYADGVINIVMPKPWILHCHVNDANGPDCAGTSQMLHPGVNYTFFYDAAYTHFNAGQSQITFSWNSRILGDTDVTINAMASGSAVNQCLAGATLSGNVMGNICVIDSTHAKVNFSIAQGSTLSSCLTGSPATCYNDGIHTAYIDTVPTSAPANYHGSGPWVGGGNWAAGTERAMINDAFQVGFDSSAIPQMTVTACAQGTTPCPRSTIDQALCTPYSLTCNNAWLLPYDKLNYTLTLSGRNNTTNWTSGHVATFGFQFPLQTVSNVVTPCTQPCVPTDTLVFTNKTTNSYVFTHSLTLAVATNTNQPISQSPPNEINVVYKAIGKLSGASPSGLGIDFASVPVGDGVHGGVGGSGGPQYSRQTTNSVIRGQSFTIRVYGINTLWAGMTCSVGPCANALTASGVDFGSDIAIDSFTAASNTQMDITGFVCDGITVHAGCTDQIAASWGSDGTGFDRIYLHGAGRVLHTGVNGDPPALANQDCAGPDPGFPSGLPQWFCYMSGGQEVLSGMVANGSNLSVINSFFDNIWNYQQGGPNDGQDIATTSSVGPCRFENNFFGGATENVFFGGSGSTAQRSNNYDPDNCLIKNNFMYKPPWWFNRGISIKYGSTGLCNTQSSGFTICTISVKNHREQKSGCHMEWTGNIMDNLWLGLVTQYSSFNMTPRTSQGQGVAGQIICDVYSHDNLTLNTWKSLNAAPTDSFCAVGNNPLLDWTCASGAFIPTGLNRWWDNNELYLFNKNEVSNAGDPPWGLFPQQMLMNTEFSHITSAFQTGVTTTKVVGWVFGVNTSDEAICANSSAIGMPLQNVKIRDSVFPNGYTSSGQCPLLHISPNPNGALNNLAHRFAGSIYPYNAGNVTSGFNTNPANGAPNYLGVSTDPLNFYSFKTTVTSNYDINPSAGWVGDYTMIGPTQIQNWINGTNTTDSLPAGYDQNMLAAAIAQTAYGGPTSNLLINTASPLPAEAVGEADTIQFSASGTSGTCGVGTYTCTWSVTSGSLPVGITLNTSNGLLSGTPSVSGTASFSLTVTDGTLTSPATPFLLPVNTRLTITPSTLPTATVGKSYSASLSQTGGLGPFVYSSTTTTTLGNCPTQVNGLCINTNGSIIGTPVSVTTQTFTAQVADSGIMDCLGPNAPACGSFSIQTNAPGLVYNSPLSLPNGTSGNAYGPIPVSVSGGQAPYTCTLQSGAWPDGNNWLTGVGGCTISGTPIMAGPYSVVILVTDNLGSTVTSGTLNFSIQTGCTLTITTTSFPAGMVSIPYGNAPLTATGCTPPYTWDIPPGFGSLPSGLSISNSVNGGSIIGVPTLVGISTFTLRVKDSNGISSLSPNQLSINIQPLVASQTGLGVSYSKGVAQK